MSLGNKMFKKFIVFCLVGVTAALVDLGMFNILFYFNVYFILSRVLAISVAWAYVFVVNRNLTFNSKEHVMKKQIPKFIVVYSIAMFVSILSSYLVLTILGESQINGNIASIAGIIIQIPITFLGSALWIFKKNDWGSLEKKRSMPLTHTPL